MTKTKGLVFGLVAAVLVMACGKEGADSEQVSDDSDHHSNHTRTALVNGKDAAAFYAQFQNRSIRYKPKDRDVVDTLNVSVVFDMGVVGRKNGDKLTAEANLYLLKNGQYTFLYREFAIDSRGVFIAQGDPRIVNGSYKVVSTRLQLSGLGEAMGATYNGYPAIFLKFEKNVGEGALKGKEHSGFIRAAKSTLAEDSLDWAPNRGINIKDLQEMGTVTEL